MCLVYHTVRLTVLLCYAFANIYALFQIPNFFITFFETLHVLHLLSVFYSYSHNSLATLLFVLLYAVTTALQHTQQTPILHYYTLFAYLSRLFFYYYHTHTTEQYNKLQPAQLQYYQRLLSHTLPSQLQILLKRKCRKVHCTLRHAIPPISHRRSIYA